MIKPIRTPTDLTRAKLRLTELLMSNQTAVHDDEIEVLSTLIEKFERTSSRIEAPSPMAAIKFRMHEMGLTPRQLEPFIGTRARVSEVLSGKRQLSIDMIRSLHEGLGIPYESLISARPTNTKVDHISAPVIDRLNSFGFDLDIEEMSTFVRTLAENYPPFALHRKTRTMRAASKTDQTALFLWQAAVLKKSESQTVATTFRASQFGADALRKLARLSTKPDGPTKVLHALAEQGISVVIVPPLPGTFLDGAVMAGPSGKPIIGLTLRHDRVDSFWFTLLHELAHVVLHFDHLSDQSAVFVDDMEIRSEDMYELEADQLARESLIPSSILSHVQWNEYTTPDEIVALGIRARVHVAIVAGRWQRDHQNYKKFARLVERGTIRSALSK